KKAKNYDTNRLAIEEIAEGKRGADPQGFAREYARAVLAKLDGKKIDAAKPRPLRDGILDWFPAEAKFVAAVDVRQGDPGNDVASAFMKLMPEQGKNEIYDLLEKTGNVRIERAAMTIVDAIKRDDEKIFVRITGKGNPAWLATYIANAPGENFQTKQIKDA